MPRLGSDAAESRWAKMKRGVKRYTRKATKSVMRSHHFPLPKYDMPLRLRPWFILFTVLILVAMAFLSFTNLAHSLLLNDLVAHFVSLMLVTGVFYFVFDVDEDARRIWFWRRAPLILTGVFCFLFGGILSEAVRSLLPDKKFQFDDVLVNLIGASIGLYIAYYLERYYRQRREISRLYRPLNEEESVLSDEEDDDLEAGTQLLPSHSHAAGDVILSPKAVPKSRLADVWDEGEELFDVGNDSDEDDSGTPRPLAASTPTSHHLSHPVSSLAH